MVGEQCLGNQSDATAGLLAGPAPCPPLAAAWSGMAGHLGRYTGIIVWESSRQTHGTVWREYNAHTSSNNHVRCGRWLLHSPCGCRLGARYALSPARRWRRSQTSCPSSVHWSGRKVQNVVIQESCCCHASASATVLLGLVVIQQELVQSTRLANAGSLECGARNKA